jgi:hypothetical protein
MIVPPAFTGLSIVPANQVVGGMHSASIRAVRR